MELKLGKCKGMTVEAVLKQPGGDKLLAGHLAFVEKGFADPQWGEKNKAYHAAIKSEWSRLLAPKAANPTIQQDHIKLGPSVDTKLDILSRQMHDIAKEIVVVKNNIDDLSKTMSLIDSRIKLNYEAAVDVKEFLANTPEEVKWEE